MNSLTPFIRHEMEDLPGTAAAPGAAGAFQSPPLGSEPEPQPQPAPPQSQPGPAVSPGQTPHPGRSSAPQGGGPVPYTDGTPAGVFQRNAAHFLAGDTPGVMASYMPENNRAPLGKADPRRAAGTQQSEETVLDLVEWREDAPYG